MDENITSLRKTYDRLEKEIAIGTREKKRLAREAKDRLGVVDPIDVKRKLDSLLSERRRLIKKKERLRTQIERGLEKIEKAVEI